MKNNTAVTYKQMRRLKLPAPLCLGRIDSGDQWSGNAPHPVEQRAGISLLPVCQASVSVSVDQLDADRGAEKFYLRCFSFCPARLCCLTMGAEAKNTPQIVLALHIIQLGRSREPLDQMVAGVELTPSYRYRHSMRVTRVKQTRHRP
ncbi:hypothetical protein RRG08_022372 [Elysia crispata]|uniref:Uncharacterized protein n=1 Tax=Elysia crispata TaxID=231223 RepID=A0AAE1D8S8_9GAST|nr:hypothetical protein RRG08_022372 [Elysia crispata]